MEIKMQLTRQETTFKALRAVFLAVPPAARPALKAELDTLMRAIGLEPSDQLFKLWTLKTSQKILACRVYGTLSGEFDDMSLEDAAETLGLVVNQVRQEIGSYGSSSRRRRHAGSGDIETLTITPIRRNDVESRLSEALRLAAHSKGGAKLPSSSPSQKLGICIDFPNIPSKKRTVLSKPAGRRAPRP